MRLAGFSCQQTNGQGALYLRGISPKENDEHPGTPVPSEHTSGTFPWGPSAENILGCLGLLVPGWPTTACPHHPLLLLIREILAVVPSPPRGNAQS